MKKRVLEVLYIVFAGAVLFFGAKALIIRQIELQTQSRNWTDQKLRRQIFMSCLTNLPTGPVHTEADTWDRVVLACDTIAEREAQTELKCDGCVKQ